TPPAVSTFRKASTERRTRRRRVGSLESRSGSVIQPRRLIRLNLGGPGRAPAGGLDLLAGENLAGACGGAGTSLVDGAVRTGTAGYRALRLGGVFDVFHRLSFLGVRAQEGCVGCHCGVLQLVG